MVIYIYENKITAIKDMLLPEGEKMRQEVNLWFSVLTAEVFCLVT